MPLFGSGHEIVTSTTRPSVPVTGQMIYETDTKNAMIYNGASWIQQSNNTLQAISTDASGRVTLPFQPAFWGNKNSAGSTGTWICNEVIVNRGSHYNTSTGLLTCPAAGAYLITMTGLGYPNPG